jgi:hypothetical protein
LIGLLPEGVANIVDVIRNLSFMYQINGLQVHLGEGASVKSWINVGGRGPRCRGCFIILLGTFPFAAFRSLL